MEITKTVIYTLTYADKNLNTCQIIAGTGIERKSIERALKRLRDAYLIRKARSVKGKRTKGKSYATYSIADTKQAKQYSEYIFRKYGGQIEINDASFN